MIKKHTLKTTIEHHYFLIAIKSVLEDYRLAYYLNKNLNLQLKKEDFSINYKQKEGEFDVFGFDNPDTNSYWSLILNKEITEEKAIFSSLFDEISKTYILIPEEKKVDYFLKIEHRFQPKEKKEIINRISKIHRVITSYEINPNSLKSKDFLIF